MLKTFVDSGKKLSAWDLYYKKFYGRNLWFFDKKLECLCKLFQPSLMFVGKARGLPESGAPERCFTRVVSSLNPNIRRGWKGLLGTNTLVYYQKLVNYIHKKFYSAGPWSKSMLGNFEIILLILFCKIAHFIIEINFFCSYERIQLTKKSEYI